MAHALSINLNRVKREMARRFWNQATLAEKSGLAAGTISNIFSRGKCSPPAAGRLAEALDLTSNQILAKRRAS